MSCVDRLEYVRPLTFNYVMHDLFGNWLEGAFKFKADFSFPYCCVNNNNMMIDFDKTRLVLICMYHCDLLHIMDNYQTQLRCVWCLIDFGIPNMSFQQR